MDKFVHSTLSLLWICASVVLASCSNDETTSTFSHREYVYCNFDILQYAELANVMGNPGQFASIRSHVVDGVGDSNAKYKITMTSAAGSHDYNTDALSEHYGLGLGGLIVGTSYFGEPLCYDLACPICDRPNRRLTISDNGRATCGKCGVVFDLNNGGVILTVPDGATLTVRRGLYRYRINFNGQFVNAYN